MKLKIVISHLGKPNNKEKLTQNMKYSYLTSDVFRTAVLKRFK